MILKASAMAYAIFIFVIIGISCYSLILLSATSKIHHTILSVQRVLVRTNETAQEYYLNTITTNTDYSSKDILDNGMYSKATIFPWGIFKILNTVTYFNRDTIKRSSLIGQRYRKFDALYLANNGKALHLAGGASIRGNVFVPEGKIKVGYITSNAFKKVDFKQGKIETSKMRLPKLKKLDKHTIATNYIISLDTLQEKKIYNPFHSKTLIIETNQRQLSGLNLKGNIKLIAKHPLYIDNTCFLEDIIIKAPKIHLGKDFKGAIQLFANEEVYLSENVTLMYPSSIYVKNDTDTKISVTLKRNSKVIGGVVIEDEEYVGNTLRLLTIEKGAKVIGKVYCNGSLDLKGEIIGGAFVDRFYLKTASSTHENYIQDGHINALKLPKEFVDIPLFDNSIHGFNYETVKFF